MKKFKVNYKVNNREQYLGIAPIDETLYSDYIECDTPEEAVDWYRQHIFEQCIDNGYDADIVGESIIVRNDEGEVIEEDYNFTADEEE